MVGNGPESIAPIRRGNTTQTIRYGNLHEDTSSPLWGRLYNSNSATDSPWARKVIVSFDGGGVRGYSSLLIFNELMKKVETKEGDSQRHPKSSTSGDYCWASSDHHRNVYHTDRFRPHHYVDYFFGTSTGGLSAIMLGRLQMTERQAMRQYALVGNNVFGKPRKNTANGLLAPRYKEKNLELCLQWATLFEPENAAGAHVDDDHIDVSTLTRDKKEIIRHRADLELLRDVYRDSSRTAVFAHGGDGARELKMFRSYDHFEPNVPNVMNDFDGPRQRHIPPLAACQDPLWKIGRATSAAPGYFERMEIGESVLKDGAMGGANNPVSHAYDEVRQMHRKHEPYMIISFGTGIKSSNHKKNGKAKFPMMDHVREISDDRKTLINEITNSQSAHEDFKRKIDDINRFQGRTEEDKIQYFRFNLPDDCDVKFGDWEGADGVVTLRKMEEAVRIYVQNEIVSTNLDNCADSLVALRRLRQETVRWEQFAFPQLGYSCSESGCTDLRFASRLKLREHLSRSHGTFWQIPCKHEDDVAYDYSCSADPCGETSVSVFKTADEFKNHLVEKHHINNPIIIDPDALENYLDNNRSWPEPKAANLAKRRNVR